MGLGNDLPAGGDHGARLSPQRGAEVRVGGDDTSSASYGLDGEALGGGGDWACEKEAADRQDVRARDDAEVDVAWGIVEVGAPVPIEEEVAIAGLIQRD